MLSSPFSSISKKTEKNLTFFLIITTVLIGYFMLFFDNYLTNSICKYGISSFELAKDINNSKAILNSWNTQSKISAGFSLGLDFLFLLLYPSLIALLIHKLNEILWKNKLFYSIGLFVLFSQIFTAIFDFIENIGLIQLLLGNSSQYWVSIAYYFSFIKFSLILVGITYIIISFIVLIIRKTKKNE